MSRKFNFSAGPAMLPKAVLQTAANEMTDWHGTGASIMEMSHRGKEFISVATDAEQDLRDLMQIPNNYKVLFMQGGATAQFTAIPMNLLRGKNAADYINTGAWSKKAITEAKRFCNINIAASGEADNFISVPIQNEWKLNPDAAYVHYTPNETISGVEFNFIPNTGNVPLVADMSSNILSRPIDVSKFGVIYAGAQKNIGPAGITVVIVHEDLIGNLDTRSASIFDYAALAKSDSMLNTPPTYSWYLAGLVFKWIKERGGLEAMAEHNSTKAAKLYDYIDNSDYYTNPVAIPNRSWMNVPFTLANDQLDKKFLKGATEKGLTTLKGHRSVGGMRASIYNAMPIEGVNTLIAYMQEFAAANS